MSGCGGRTLSSVSVSPNPYFQRPDGQESDSHTNACEHFPVWGTHLGSDVIADPTQH